MRKTELIGRLEHRGVWAAAGTVRRRIAHPTCAAIHRAVTLLGPGMLPADLVLKHTYDYRPIWVDPSNIGLLLKSAAWRRDARGKPQSAWFRDWYQLGGGWKSVSSHVSRNLHGRFIADGDWDLAVKPMGILPVVYQLFHEGRLPQETDDYKKQADRIEAGLLSWTRGSTLDELDEHYERLVRIYEDMRANGYRTQGEVGGDGADEIRVCIDRDGRMCVFGGGTHRLSIAKLLGLDRVPVLVKRVHYQWVEEWKAAAGTENPVVAVALGVGRLETESREGSST